MSKLSGKIVRVAQDEKARNYKFYEESKKLDNNIQIISVDDLDGYRKEGYIIPTDTVEGAVLTLHPFHPKEYIDINVVEDVIIREKINNIGELVQLLGARKVEGHAVFVEAKKQEMNGVGEISYKAVKLETSVKTSEETKYSNDYKLERTFIGVRSADNYSRAQEIMNKYGLYKDYDIKTLFEMCNPDRNNMITSQKVRVDISREINSSKECAFKLGVLEIFKLDAKVEKSVSELKTVRFECCIEF